MTDELNQREQLGSVYEDAVRDLRRDPNRADFLRNCYLDNPAEAAQRFAASEEFHEVRSLLSFRSGTVGARVLDVGAGNGIASYAFASIGCDVVSLEPDPSPIVGRGAVDSLKRLLTAGSITAVGATIEEYLDRGECFDAVYMRQVAHHFASLSNGVARCAELLKPGGVLLLTREHVIDRPQDLEVFRRNHSMTEYGVEEYAYSVEQYRSALLDAGLSGILELGPYDSLINYYPLTREKVLARALEMISRNYGRLPNMACGRLPFMHSWAMRKLSRVDRQAGMLYSFRGTKP